MEKYRLQNYPAGGTGMIFFKTVKDNLPESLAPSILNLLQKIDDIVAREVDKQPDISSINSLMKDVIAKP